MTWGSQCVPWETRVVSERASLPGMPGVVTGASINESPAHQTVQGLGNPPPSPASPPLAAACMCALQGRCKIGGSAWLDPGRCGGPPTPTPAQASPLDSFLRPLPPTLHRLSYLCESRACPWGLLPKGLCSPRPPCARGGEVGPHPGGAKSPSGHVVFRSSVQTLPEH